MSDPIIIKKYSNRRLYHTALSRCVTLEDVAEMVRREEDFVVVDAVGGKDITHAVLTQILLEKENAAGESLLPVDFLRRLIRFYGAGMQDFVPHYLTAGIDALLNSQEEILRDMAKAFDPTAPQPTSIMDHMRRNCEIAAKTLSMTAPAAAAFFPPDAVAKPAASSTPPAAGKNGKNRTTPSCAAPSSSDEAASSDELEVLRRRLDALGARVDRLSRGR